MASSSHSRSAGNAIVDSRTALRRRSGGLAAGALSAFLTLGGPSASAAEPATRALDTARLDAAFDKVVAEQGLPLAGFVIVDDRGEVYRRVTTGLDPDAEIPIASASKWLTGVMVMTLVDEGKLSLDTTVGEVLPDYPAQVRAVTLRQLMSHTSGIDPGLALRDRDATSLDESARAVASAPLLARPGEAFAYGGSSMQLAARMAEVACRCSWSELYERTLRAPLGMTGGRWGHPLRPEATVPQVGGGLSLSLNDYVKFLTMVQRGGRSPRSALLPTAAVAGMERVATGSARFSDTPRVGLSGWRYGIGVWCERIDADGRCPVVSSAGAFGVYPWVDRDAGLAGVFFTRAPLQRVLPAAIDLREIATRKGP